MESTLTRQKSQTAFERREQLRNLKDMTLWAPFTDCEHGSQFENVLWNANRNLPSGRDFKLWDDLTRQRQCPKVPRFISVSGDALFLLSWSSNWLGDLDNNPRWCSLVEINYAFDTSELLVLTMGVLPSRGPNYIIDVSKVIERKFYRHQPSLEEALPTRIEPDRIKLLNVSIRRQHA